MSAQRMMLAVLASVLGASAMAQGVTLPEIERIMLDNGVVLILHEKDDVPLIGLEASIRGGAVSDPVGLAAWRTCWQAYWRRALASAMLLRSPRLSTQ